MKRLSKMYSREVSALRASLQNQVQKPWEDNDKMMWRSSTHVCLRGLCTGTSVRIQIQRTWDEPLETNLYLESGKQTINFDANVDVNNWSFKTSFFLNTCLTNWIFDFPSTMRPLDYHWPEQLFHFFWWWHFANVRLQISISKSWCLGMRRIR